MCCVAKLYSKILNTRLQKFLESNKILVEEQNGFRASRSCIDHIFVLCTILRNRKLSGKETFLSFIDFQKAFDSVDRNFLFSQSVSLTQYVVLPVRPPVPVSLLSKRPSSFCLIHFVGTSGAARGQKRTFDGRHLWWKRTLDGRRPLMEDDLWWKKTYDGRRLMMKDDLWWKAT